MFSLSCPLSATFQRIDLQSKQQGVRSISSNCQTLSSTWGQTSSNYTIPFLGLKALLSAKSLSVIMRWLMCDCIRALARSVHPDKMETIWKHSLKDGISLDFLNLAQHLKNSPRYVNVPRPQAVQLCLVSISLCKPVGVETEIRGVRWHHWTN